MIEYAKRLVEVDEILNYLSHENFVKIPEKVRKAIKENKDKEYVWKYDKSKTLLQQNLNRDTIAFLSYLNMEYLLNNEQKELMEQMHELNQINAEREKQKRYNTDMIFKRDNKDTKENAVTTNKVEMVVYKKKHFFTKLIDRIKNIFDK